MLQKPRKIIFETMTGSKLYGTNRPDSDVDFMGVYLPSTKESFGLNPFSKGTRELDLSIKKSTGLKNSKEYTDRKFYRLDVFLNLLAEGKSQPLEMLFSPKENWIVSTPEWDFLLQNKDLFVSKKSIFPFCRFAKAQSLKSVSKGENLNIIREIIKVLELKNQNGLISKEMELEIPIFRIENKITIESMPDNVNALVIAGKKYLFTQKVKDVKRKLIDLEKEYGKRSQQASEEGYDYKSLSHAYRLLFQVETLLKTGSLSFPLPLEQVVFLKSVRDGSYKANYFEELDSKMKYINQLESSLPNDIDIEKIDLLCQKMLFNHLMVK